MDPNADPSRRLETLIVQQQARDLLKREDDLFLDSDDSNPKEPK